ncbi:MAG: cation-translocating P-type ATPase [Planctomycetes bacterium]|nr:cation-translocating P-type ATPase [Planctomycetota bacterium]
MPDSSEAKPTLAPHAHEPEALAHAHGSDLARGMTAVAANAARERWGSNELDRAAPEPAWRKLAAQFKDLVVWMLMLAAVLAGVLGEWADTLAILAIVLLNGILGYLQEAKAERALAALRNMSAPQARALRDGRVQALPASELVPGDLIELEAGDHVPADARLIESFGLRVQEAMLTGESEAAEKQAGPALDGETPLGDRCNTIYMGTLAAAGRARALVTATGMRTELGRIARLLEQGDTEPTPLQRRIAELGRMLAVLCLAIVAVIFVLQLLRGGSLIEVFLLAVSLAVAAVPEGLPAVVTVALALGLQRMAKRHALIRKLPSVETLGAVTVICSDKTGTLTRNEMTVKLLLTAERGYHVTGSGYGPKGRIFLNDETLLEAGAAPPLWETQELEAHPACRSVTAEEDAELARLLSIGARCNAAQVLPDAAGQTWKVLGDPTEGALIVAARKAGVEAGPGKTVDERPFDSERKLMSVVFETEAGALMLYAKGAPEMLLARCTHEWRGGNLQPLDEARRAHWMRLNEALAERALRVLAFAWREQPERDEKGGFAEQGLVFAGLCGMLDPPREEARAAVRRCQDAGIRAVMITGDHPRTARAIARDLGMAGENDEIASGQDLDGWDDAALDARIARIAVYARVTAEHKLRVVEALKRAGEVVAMTGDGVNDAPAVRRADIGIAMGRTGTDVTKEASDMVLTDDNFASIVDAVEEGRGIFDDIRKFVHYLLSCNAGEVLIMFGAASCGWPVPLAPIQILWMNLVTDGFPALALGMEPPERGVMKRPPRPAREPVVTWPRGWRMLRHGLLIAAAALIGFWLTWQENDANLIRARTVTFCVAAFAQLFFALSCRSLDDTYPQLGLFTNPVLLAALVLSATLQLAVVSVPFLQEHFKVELPALNEFWLILGLALAPVTLIEVGKLLKQAWTRRSG